MIHSKDRGKDLRAIFLLREACLFFTINQKPLFDTLKTRYSGKFQGETWLKVNDAYSQWYVSQ